MERVNAVVYCEGAFDSTYGKTAHGLVRFTERYNVLSVIDSTLAGQDAAEVLDGKARGIPLVRDLPEALSLSREQGLQLSHFVVGIATDGGFLDEAVEKAALDALAAGLNVDSGLHEFISDLPAAGQYLETGDIKIRDIRKPPSRRMHAFTGKIESVGSVRIATMGTDSAIGKRTTAWILVHALRKAGQSAEMIGTGQTAWMQGAEYGIILDSLLNDYISGELEHAVCSAWEDKKMDFAVIEGQGSLMNPGYPGGFEILAAGRPHGIIMQHAPSRKEYDGFPGYPLDSLNDQIHIAEFLSHKPVVAVTINHEGIPRDQIDAVCKEVEQSCARPVLDPLYHGADALVPLLMKLKK
ncbi:MAG: DUF1611 domain-containing protein [Spirochaetales bacterium]|nr:DUF1611 domain-containing protein [Spirochaetales bacterium]